MDTPVTTWEVTRLLAELPEGGPDALARLVPVVYQELRRLARAQLSHERAGHTLQATALAHEAFLKLAGETRIDYDNRAHFFSVAARAMRQLLTDHARRRQSGKRGGGAAHGSLDDNDLAFLPQTEQLLSINLALDELAEVDPRLARVVELRFYAGMTEEEVASVLDVTTRTVQRDWAVARAWLFDRLQPGWSTR